MKLFKKVFTFAVAGLGVVTLIGGFSPIVLAQSATVTEARCTIAKDRLTTRIETVTETTQTHTTIYSTVKERVDSTISRATKAGYDGTSLTETQTAMDTAIGAYEAKATTYTSSLTATRDAACNEDESVYSAALETARTALTDVREAASSVQTTMKDSVFPALNEYATWLQAEANELDGGQET